MFYKFGSIFLVGFVKSDFSLIVTGNRSSKGHESNGVDGIFEVDEASEMAGDITNDSSTNTDHGNGHHKTRIAFSKICGDMVIVFQIKSMLNTRGMKYEKKLVFYSIIFVL